MERLRHVFHTEERKVIVSIDRLDLCKVCIVQAWRNPATNHEVRISVEGFESCCTRA